VRYRQNRSRDRWTPPNTRNCSRARKNNRAIVDEGIQAAGPEPQGWIRPSTTDSNLAGRQWEDRLKTIRNGGRRRGVDRKRPRDSTPERKIRFFLRGRHSPSIWRQIVEAIVKIREGDRTRGFGFSRRSEAIPHAIPTGAAGPTRRRSGLRLSPARHAALQSVILRAHTAASPSIAGGWVQLAREINRRFEGASTENACAGAGSSQMSAPSRRGPRKAMTRTGNSAAEKDPEDESLR